MKTLTLSERNQTKLNTNSIYNKIPFLYDPRKIEPTVIESKS